MGGRFRARIRGKIQIPSAFATQQRKYFTAQHCFDGCAILTTLGEEARSGIKDLAIRKTRQVQVLLKYSEHDSLFCCHPCSTDHAFKTSPFVFIWFSLCVSNDLLLKFPLLQLMQNSVLLILRPLR